MSSLSSATFWSNSTDLNNTSSKLLHGFSQLDAETLGSLAPGMFFPPPSHMRSIPLTFHAMLSAVPQFQIPIALVSSKAARSQTSGLRQRAEVLMQSKLYQHLQCVTCQVLLAESQHCTVSSQVVQAKLQ